jgi:hypothetical protein
VQDSNFYVGQNINNVDLEFEDTFQQEKKKNLTSKMHKELLKQNKKYME